MNSFDIHPANLIKALSMALELAINGMSQHHWRTALICKRLAEQMRMDKAAEETLVYAALLHDIGAASNWDERKMLKDLERVEQVEIVRHARNGYLLLRESARLGALAKPILYHHELWAGGNPSGLKGAEIPLSSRIIHLADRIEVLLDEKKPIFTQKSEIIQRIKEKSGRDFDPETVEAFLESSKCESFWLDLENPAYYGIFFKSLEIYGASRYTIDDAIQVSEIFATIIDKMSAFTATHSRSVARISALLAELKGFCADEVKNMRIAGLLHDLGKLAIPNEILEKPSALTSSEVMIIRQHTYYTYRILEPIDGFKMIARWAAYHHETLDGTGYPFRIHGDSLPLGSRIVAVADVFVALTEHRPYRANLPADKVKSIMMGMAQNNKLDGGITQTLFDHFQVATEIMQSVQEQEG